MSGQRALKPSPLVGEGAARARSASAAGEGALRRFAGQPLTRRASRSRSTLADLSPQAGRGKKARADQSAGNIPQETPKDFRVTHPSIHAKVHPDKIAYQMAGTGKANPRSLIEALRLAAAMSERAEAQA